jgi:hypothetical protein
MKIRYCDLLFASAVLTMAAPAWAHTDTAMLTFDKSVHIGTTMLDPSSYKVRADENASQIEVERNGKVVAQIPCHWIQLNSKSPSDEAVIDNDSIQQIRFEGRAAAAQFE